MSISTVEREKKKEINPISSSSPKWSQTFVGTPREIPQHNILVSTALSKPGSYWFAVALTGRNVSYIVELTSSSADVDESWFWSEEWQAGEREAEEDFKAGRYEDFDTIDSLITYLHAENKKQKRKNK